MHILFFSNLYHLNTIEYGGMAKLVYAADVEKKWSKHYAYEIRAVLIFDTIKIRLTLVSEGPNPSTPTY